MSTSAAGAALTSAGSFVGFGTASFEVCELLAELPDGFGVGKECGLAGLETTLALAEIGIALAASL
ncbi:MAG: hypothetical protein L0Z07_01100, partial [Planctomycetes bacterium]|nr:hypothetical protein [Planctomycetota bacterium]